MERFRKEKLEEVAKNSLYTTFTNSKTIEYSYKIFKRHLKVGSILELGPAEGLMTDKLIEHDESLFVVEGSRIYSEALKVKYPKITVVNSLFEEAELNMQFDNIVLGHVLEHVCNPEIVLSKVKSWLKPNGIILAAVPNARSIHRQAAVEMGLISSIFDMSYKDKHHGHLRIYSPETLKTEFIKLGLKITNFGGYWLKPISDKQIQESWSEEMLEAFMALGEVYPDIAAEIYIIAK